MNETSLPSPLYLTPSEMATVEPACVLFNSQAYRQQGTRYTSLPKKEYLVPTSFHTKREKCFSSGVTARRQQRLRLKRLQEIFVHSCEVKDELMLKADARIDKQQFLSSSCA